MSTLAVQFLSAFFTTLFAIIILAPIAKRIALIDEPSARKLHNDRVPIIGGVAIFITFCVGMWIWGGTDDFNVTFKGQPATMILLVCSGVLVVTGALDDRFDLGVFLRVISELLVAVAIIETLDLRLVWLGDLFGMGKIMMSDTTSYIFTVVSIFGLMNAFNMLDGIDGLLASLVITSVLSFHALTATNLGPLTIFLLGCLSAFLVSNLGVSKFIPRSFLGDSGSKLLGFVMVCLLLGAASTQVGGSKLINPVTALFIVSIPLFDMVFTTLRRVIRKGSPFAADRGHIHHLMQDLGFSDRRALVLVVAMSVSLNFLGLMLHRSIVAEYHQFAIFCGCFALYCLLTSQAWRVAEKMKGENISPLANGQ